MHNTKTYTEEYTTRYMRNVLILGAGEIGRAIDHILAPRKDIFRHLWDKNADRVPRQRPLADAASSCSEIFVCVPSSALRNAIASITPHLSHDAVIVTLTKGIERETCKTTDKLMEELLPDHPAAILAGPMIAEELLQDTPGAGVIGTRDAAIFERVGALFAGTKLTVTHGKDPQAIALCSVMKNIYAVALGMIEATGDGANMRGMFFARALDEMMRVLRHLGAAPEAACGVAGIGDLIATATSSYSRNRIVGEEFAQGKTQRMDSEGLSAIPCIPALLGSHLEEFGILNALYRVIEDDGQPIDLVHAVRA